MSQYEPLTHLGTTSLNTGMVEDITSAQARIGDMPDGEVEKTFTDYQAETYTHCKSLVKNAQAIAAKGKDNPSEIVTSSRELTVSYGRLVEATQGALATIESSDVSQPDHTPLISSSSHANRLPISCSRGFMWWETCAWS